MSCPNRVGQTWAFGNGHDIFTVVETKTLSETMALHRAIIHSDKSVFHFEEGYEYDSFEETPGFTRLDV
jgi:hypothetical protein